MRYRRPFDSRQRAAAVRAHQQYRRNLKELRERFPAGNERERVLLRAYRESVQDFARELLLPDDRLDPQRLTELERHATNAGLRYIVTRSARTGFGHD